MGSKQAHEVPACRYGSTLARNNYQIHSGNFANKCFPQPGTSDILDDILAVEMRQLAGHTFITTRRIVCTSSVSGLGRKTKYRAGAAGSAAKPSGL
jgi:hypothetical protein